MYRKTIVAVLVALTSIVAWADGTTWTIAVAPSGTKGGYFETASGASQTAVPYSTTWPAGDLYPTFYVHFPAGSFSVVSSNAAAVKVDVRDMTTGQDLLTSAAATGFSFTAPQEGWYRWRLSGGTAGSTVLSDFTVNATSALTGTNTNVWLADWRCVPSLHISGFGSTNTQMPSGAAYDWFYDEVLMPTDADFLGTYIEAIDYGSGYLGIQNTTNSDGEFKRIVILAGWDNGDTDSDPELADYKRSGVVATGTAESVVAERFAGEGTGTHIMMYGNLWKPGQWVRFLLNTRPEQILLPDGTTFNNTLVSAWYMAEGVDTEWQYVGTIRLAGRSQYFAPSNSFLEEFTRGNTSQGNMAHKGYYRRYFTRSMQTGTWYNRNIFNYTHTDGGTADGARNDTNQTTLDNYDGEPAIYMESGGYCRNEREIGSSTMAYREPDGIVPTDATLQDLYQTYVATAIQTQDEQRMAVAINAAQTKVSSSEWSVVASSSEETSGEGATGRAAHAIDGDASTYWHTAWYSASSNYPHSLTLLHNGAVTLSQLTLSLPSGRNTGYSAKRVTVSRSDNGSAWTEVGSYTLDAASTQAISFASDVTTTYLKLDFTEGNGQQYLVIGEIAFYQHNLAEVKALAQQYVDGAGQFNGYDVNDTQTALCLNVLRNLLSDDSSTLEQYTTALNALAENGKMLKCGKAQSVTDLSADHVYYITNAYGFGAMVAASADATYPTLRNAAPEAGSDKESTCKNVYKQSMSVTDELAGWRIITSEEYPGYYYLYNIGTGKYLNFAEYSTLSDTPVPTLISLSGRGFVFSLKTAPTSTDYLCAAPQNDESTALGYWATSDQGSQWYIYDNYALTPAITDNLTTQLRSEVNTASHSESYASEGVVLSLKGQYATFCSARDLDFSGVEGITPYVATSFNDGVVQMSSVASLKSNTGVVIKGETGDYEVPFAATTPAAVANLLVAATEATVIGATAGGNTNFILANGSNGIGFYPLKRSGTIAAGRAYLSLPSAQLAEVKAIGLNFDDTTVGLDGQQMMQAASAQWYDLQGRSVSADTARKGVYIVDGHKTVVR